MEVLIWLNLDQLIYRIFFPLPQPRQKRNEKKAYEKTRNSFRWITLRECSSGCLVGIFFIGVLNRGEVENWTCKNSPLFSGSPKSFAAKADFVLCLASHFHTTRQFLHFYIFTILYNGCLLPFYNPFFSLSQRYLLSLAKEQIDNTAVFFSKSKKNLEIKSFLTSQRIGYLSLFSRKRRFFSLHIFSLHTEEYERKKRKITTSRFWRICDGVWKGFSMFDPDFETVWGKSWSIPEQLQLSRLTQGEVRWAKGEKYTEHLWQIHVTTLTNPFSDLDNRWSDHQVDKDDWDDQDNHRGVDDLDNCQDHRDCEALEYLEDGEKDDGDLGKGDV